MDRVVEVLESLRLGASPSEYWVQGEIARVLEVAGLRYLKEYRLGPGARVDFLVEDGTVIEVKRGKPDSGKLAAQVDRYCSFAMVTGLVIVVTASVFDVPSEAHGKRVAYVALNRLWGVSV